MEDQNSQPRSVPNSFSIPPNRQQATNRLASSPAHSLPRSLHNHNHHISSSEDDTLDRRTKARRLRRHLVTRPDDNDGGDDEDGYAGDINNDDDDGVVDPMTLPSGDTTYGIYKWHRQASSRSTPSNRIERRRGSFSGVPSESEWDVPFTSQRINEPGGFRRQFLYERSANLAAGSFVEFIGLYGHFAGADYSTEEEEEEEEPDPEEQPLLQVPSRASSTLATASNGKVFFLLLKAFVGTGVLVLPKAFSNGGLLASFVVMLFVAWYAWHTMVLLGQVYLRVGGSYSELGDKLYGPAMGRLITISIVMAQLGFCSAYTIFVATNLRSAWNALTGCTMNMSKEWWVLLQLLAYIPLSWIRKIKRLAPFALLANLCIMSGLGYVLVFDLLKIQGDGMAPILQYNPARFPLLVGTAVFAYEGVTLVIPVLDTMRHKEQFSQVLTGALGVCIVVFIGVAALSYMAFGDKVETVVLLNLPDAPATILVQLLYSLAIMLSVPLQLFPAVRILESNLFEVSRSGKISRRVKWQKNMFRALLVGMVSMVATLGADQLDNFVAIIGALSCTPLSFIFPSLLHYRISSEGCCWVRWKNLGLALLGSVIMVYVTYIGVASWGKAPGEIDQCM